MLRRIDSFIDNISMYRLLLYYLGALLLVAIGLSLFKDLHYNAAYIAISTGILVAACWAINHIFAYIFNAPINGESSLITAFILALIITPQPTGYGITFLLAASGLAMASKYILTINEKHIFNPAAIAVALTALGPKQSASWWVATAPMLPYVLIGGLLIMRKIRRERMVLTFLIATSVATTIYSLQAHTSVSTGLHDMLISSPVLFLAFVMLTEPLTSPPTKAKQTWYAILVGVLVPPQAHILSYYSTPELALLIGNVFAYIVSPKVKLFPVLKQKIKIARDTLDFVFTPDRALAYQPGQYIEWTLQHKPTDSRGSRRFFTLASSPTEPDIRIGVKFYEQGSTFKQALGSMTPETYIVASQVAGDFVLPKNQSKKLVFIAGGIGITPFRSMVKYLIDTEQTRTVTLLYSARTQADFAYKDVFEEARQAIGLKTTYTVTDREDEPEDANTITGPITAALIQRTVPDYQERIFYISGTHHMVEDVQDILKTLNVHHKNIKIDFFPGYA